jgi:hypothetical protein
MKSILHGLFIEAPKTILASYILPFIGWWFIAGVITYYLIKKL